MLAVQPEVGIVSSYSLYTLDLHVYKLQGRNHQIGIGQAKFLLTINNR